MNTESNNTAITLEEFEARHLSENYDHRALYLERIAPLVQQIHEICTEHKVPFVASFAAQNDEKNIGFYTSLLFCGPERTPAEFILVKKALYEVNDVQALSLVAAIDAANNMEQVLAGIEAQDATKQ